MVPPCAAPHHRCCADSARSPDRVTMSTVIVSQRQQNTPHRRLQLPLGPSRAVICTARRKLPVSAHGPVQQPDSHGLRHVMARRTSRALVQKRKASCTYTQSWTGQYTPSPGLGSIHPVLTTLARARQVLRLRTLPRRETPLRQQQVPRAARCTACRAGTPPQASN